MFIKVISTVFITMVCYEGLRFTVKNIDSIDEDFPVFLLLSMYPICVMFSLSAIWWR